MVIIKEYPGDLLVRSAQVGDVDAVMQIEAFGELDHIRAMYDTYIDQPDYHAFVGEINGRVIAFCYVCITDNGETAFRGGKRIHQDFRGKGYLSKFIDPVEDYVSSLFSAVKRWRYIATHTEYQKKHIPVLREAGALLKLVFNNYFLITASMSDFTALGHHESVQKLTKAHALSEVVCVGNSKIPDCLMHPSTQEDLFPDDSVAVLWEVYRTIRVRLQNITYPWDCFITYSGNGQSKVKAVSFMSEILTNETTLRRGLEIYVNKALSRDEKMECVKQHIVNACVRQSSKNQSVRKIYMGFFFSRNIDVDNIRIWVIEKFQGVSAYYQDGNTDGGECLVCDYDREKWMEWNRSRTC